MHKLKSKTEKVRVQFKIMKGGKFTFILFGDPNPDTDPNPDPLPIGAQNKGVFAVSGENST